jgi:serine phosphatase RsbU (regulator of sigma subunit)
MKQLEPIRILLLIGLIFFAAFSLQAQVREKIKFPDYYRYHIGDQSQWAQPDFDDSLWKKAKWGSFPVKQWQGIGWLRYELEVDASLLNKAMGFTLEFQGAVEIYLDGQLICQRGKVGTSAASEEPYIEHETFLHSILFHPPPYTRDKNSHHTLAVRYSSFFLELPAWSGGTPYFRFNIDDLERLNRAAARKIKVKTIHQMFLVGVYVALALLHLMLFLFSTKMRENLFFALFTASSALAVFFIMEAYQVNNPGGFLVHLWAFNISLILLCLWGLLFLYSLLYDRPPKIFLIFSLAGVVLFTWNFFQPLGVHNYVVFFCLLTVPEIIRAIVIRSKKKIKRPIEGRRIIGIGAVPLIFTGLYQTLVELHVIDELWHSGSFPRPFYAVLVLMIAMSIFLVRRFAMTSKKLEAKLVQVRELSEEALEQQRACIQLEAENARKNQELEEARKLQLSMLPKSVPVLPLYQIGVYMQTATEVGGDYYDFFTAEDGILTVVIGDATGHGLQAGTMVTAAKSLFNAFAPEPKPVTFLKKTSMALRKMGFRKMFMAMTLAKFKGYHLEVAAAGMPFTLIFRAADNIVEEVVLKGIPLGSFKNFPYKQAAIDLGKGDTVLFMSDGLPETFNPQEEMLGFERVKDLFLEVGTETPDNIIVHLVEAGKEWAEGLESHDDVTLMVIKIK